MSTESRRPISIEDLWAIRRPGAPAASPDGTVIVLPVTEYDMEANEGNTRLHRVLPGSGGLRPLTRPDVSSTEPALSPDGTRVAFVRTAKDAPGQLAVLPLDGGEAEILTDFPLGVMNPRWFPEGRRIAFLAWVYQNAPTPEGSREHKTALEKEPVKARVTENRVYRFWDKWLTDGRVPHLFVIDLDGKGVIDLVPDSRRWFDLMDPSGHYDISPDGEEVAFSANSSEPPYQRLNWDIFTVPARGGAVRNLTEDNPADDIRPRYSPDGSAILYGLQRDPEFYADRVRLAVVDRASGNKRVLTETWDRSAMGWEFVPGTTDIRFLAEDDGRHAVYRTDLSGAEPSCIHRGGTLDALRPLADGSILALRNTVSEPPDLVRLSADGSRINRPAPLNESLLAEIEFGKVEEIRFVGSEDREIQAYVVLPPGFDPKKRWPLVEVLHGGPHGITSDQFHFRWNLQLLAAPGYVVVAPNFHGSTSWGQGFAECIQGSWGDRPYRDAMAAVDHLVAGGSIDTSRMAAAGGSYGGYLVTWIAGQTDRFACIVSHAGVADLLAEYASDVTVGWGKAMGGEPWNGIEGIDRSNPIRFARGFRTPMLVTHGELDYRVPVDQGIELYNILQAKGVPSRLVILPDENHWVLKPRNSRFWLGEIQAWLARWIGTGPS